MPATSYAYLRALEIEGRHPADAGAWQVTIRRLEAGEGLPPQGRPESRVEYAEGAPLPPTPELPPSVLRAGRSVFYRRLRSPAECERYLEQLRDEVRVSLRLFAGWADPPGGVIPMPGPGEQPLPLSHSVAIMDFSSQVRRFHFQNGWGEQWGDGGTGYLPYDYFDKYVFECWGRYYQPSYLQREERAAEGRREVRWTVRDEWDRRVYGFEVRDERGDNRWGWAFVLERDGALEVEELYVRPEFRQRGHGRWLAEQVARLAGATKGQVVRLWVPFADSRREDEDNQPALVAVARRLGLAFRPCPVPWAAYLATNELAPDSSPEPIEPASRTQRPHPPWDVVRAFAPAASLAINGAPSGGPFPPPAVAAQADFPAVGTKAWGLMNRRRAELIRKKNRQGLTPEERAEYERLQTMSRTALEEAFPGPPADDERLDRLEARLRASEGRKE